jgi:ketosteroid isomerase-like protein
MLRCLAVALLAAGSASPAPPEGNAALAEQVRRTEAAFARTMAERDHAAFVAHLAEEAIFFGPAGPLRGRAAVAAAWKKFYEGREAPFSWRPEEVAVLDSGTLALTAGPVLDPSGKPVGTFHSVWRREPDGNWKIVLDKGCDCPPRAPAP